MTRPSRQSRIGTIGLGSGISSKLADYTQPIPAARMNPRTAGALTPSRLPDKLTFVLAIGRPDWRVGSRLLVRIIPRPAQYTDNSRQNSCSAMKEIAARWGIR